MDVLETCSNALTLFNEQRCYARVGRGWIGLDMYPIVFEIRVGPRKYKVIPTRLMKGTQESYEMVMSVPLHAHILEDLRFSYESFLVLFRAFVFREQFLDSNHTIRDLIFIH